MSEEQENTTVELSEGEQKARNNGWVPQEEWKGKPDDWVDYRQFNFRGELMSRINEQSSIIKHLTNKVSERDAALDDLVELNKKTAETQYKRALEELRARKIEALEEQDHATVMEIDDQIEELKEKKPKPVPQQQQQRQQQVSPEITQWLQDPKNSWYHTDPTMRAIADGAARQERLASPSLSDSELLRRVEQQVKQSMPHKFKTNNAPATDTGGEYSGTPSSRGKTPSWSDLTDEQKTIATRYEKIGLMNKKDYIKALVDAGEL